MNVARNKTLDSTNDPWDFSTLTDAVLALKMEQAQNQLANWRKRDGWLAREIALYITALKDEQQNRENAED